MRRAFTEATREDTEGVMHVVANEAYDRWGAACDFQWSMPRERLDRSAYGNDVPTCLRCIVRDAAWWRGHP